MVAPAGGDERDGGCAVRPADETGRERELPRHAGRQGSAWRGGWGGGRGTELGRRT